MTANLDLAAVFAPLRREHRVDASGYQCSALNGDECSIDCGADAHNRALDTAAAQVAAMLDERGAVLARAVEALRVTADALRLPRLSAHDRTALIVGIDAVLADPVGARAVEEWRAMVARLAMATRFSCGDGWEVSGGKYEGGEVWTAHRHRYDEQLRRAKWEYVQADGTIAIDLAVTHPSRDAAFDALATYRAAKERP